MSSIEDDLQFLTQLEFRMHLRKFDACIELDIGTAERLSDLVGIWHWDRYPRRDSVLHQIELARERILARVTNKLTA